MAESRTEHTRPVLKIPSVVMWALWCVGNPIGLTSKQRQEWLETGSTQLNTEQQEQLDELIASWWNWGEKRVETF